ncbi:hypothetical protein [Haloarchaeobius sp. DT45]|uniref:hypothetical protein n=1 Tax=Haloarchaeobius sp. DT45 TaxID=3446116 RepID=UPI003F6C68AF
MEKFTFLEVHLNGETTFGPNVGGDGYDDETTATDGGTAAMASGSTSASESSTVDERDDETDERSSAPNPLFLLAGFVALVLVAVGVRKLVGGDDEAFEPEMVELEDE